MRQLVFVGLLFVLSCGGSTSNGGGGGGPSSGGAGSSGAGSASCMFTETIAAGNTTLSIAFCSDTLGLTADQVNALKTTCTSHPAAPDAAFTISGAYSDGPCPSANRIGGCNVTSGGYSQTAWYYAGEGITPSQVQMICQQSGGVFVPP